MGAAAGGWGLELDFAAGVLDDFVGEEEADAVVGGALGGEEGFEDALAEFVGNAGAVVDDVDLIEGGAGDDAESDGGGGGAGDGLDGVVDDVEDGAGEFAGDALPFAGFVDVGVEGDLVHDDLEIDDGGEVLDHVADGDGLGVAAVLGDEEEAAEFLAGALEGAVDDEEAVEDIFVEAILHGEELGGAEGGGEGVVDFVGEGGGELAEGFLPMLAEHALVELVDGELHFDALFQLVLELLDAEGGAGAGEEFGLFDGLGEVIMAADLESADLVLHFKFGGEEKDGDVAGVLVGLEAAADFEAVHLGHHDVQNDDIDGLFGEEFEGGAAGVGGQTIEARVLKADLEEAQGLGLVVNGQNPGLALNTVDCFQIGGGGSTV